MDAFSSATASLRPSTWRSSRAMPRIRSSARAKKRAKRARTRGSTSYSPANHTRGKFFMEPKALDNLASIRTDVVGSLLRPNHLKQAYAEREQKKINDDDLRRIEDDAIREAVRLQEEAGLDVITDGEYRRLNFQDSFAASV